MTSQELKSKVAIVNALNSQTIASDTTTNGVKLDLKGYESCVFELKTGVVTAGDVQALIEDSPDNSVFTPVTDTFLNGTELLTNISTSHGITTIGYVGKQRYVRLSAVTDNSANLIVTASAVKGNAHNQPAV